MVARSRGASRGSDAYTSISLQPAQRGIHAYRKKQEMLKIALDNVSMRNRIVSTPAYYRLKDCKEHMNTHKHLLQMHCEYPLVLEKGEEKPQSSYNARTASAQIVNSSSNQSAREQQAVEAKQRQFKISKIGNHGRLSSTSEGFFKKPEEAPESPTIKHKHLVAAKPKFKTQVPPTEKPPKSSINSILMTRHFLHEDLILIFEDVLQHDGRLYHCSLTKPK